MTPILSATRFRQFHRLFAPLIILPLLLSLVTGSTYQIAQLAGQGGDFYWLIEIHTGKFGPLDLTMIYPFLNAFGLLFMAGTGISMWIQMQRLFSSR
ncbi:MAG: PepSY domain-containing protein [Synechococcaceae cyanobacterium SM2_3_1]|nr:PepSY domain-containing protein [Synechococcaceae cyanobacterium SM2_3_1]